MITIDQYFGGRRTTHSLECSPGIGANAARTVDVVNSLLLDLVRFDIVPPINPTGDFAGGQLTSGWRPPSVNSCTPGASATSLHMTGEACDVYDPDGTLDAFLRTPEGQFLLVTRGLWMEDPSHTPGWCHVQTRPPRSGHRVFVP